MTVVKRNKGVEERLRRIQVFFLLFIYFTYVHTIVFGLNDFLNLTSHFSEE